MEITPDHPGFSFAEHGGFERTSPCDANYNCIAHAAGDRGRWWEPDPDDEYYWPEEATRSYTLEAYREAFESLGFRKCDGMALEPGYEKVALFAQSGAPKHASIQIAAGRNSGKWSSKLGKNIDVLHELHGASGPCYGTVVLVLRRRIDKGNPLLGEV